MFLRVTIYVLYQGLNNNAFKLTELISFNKQKYFLKLIVDNKRGKHKNKPFWILWIVYIYFDEESNSFMGLFLLINSRRRRHQDSSKNIYSMIGQYINNLATATKFFIPRSFFNSHTNWTGVRHHQHVKMSHIFIFHAWF